MVLIFLFISSKQILAASYSCYWDAATNTCNCNNPVNPVTLTWTSGTNDDQAVFKVDMSKYINLYLSVEFQDPNKWVLNIGDSSTNNGWGGDAATFYNDAEIQILNTQMSLYFNQYDYLNPDYNLYAGPDCNPYAGLRCPYPSASMNDVILLHGTSNARFLIQDQFLRVNYAPTNSNLKLQSPYLLRIGGKDHEQPSGNNDKTWYVGVNRVISPVSSSASRTGQGVKRIWFTLTDNPLPPTPCDSPILPPSSSTTSSSISTTSSSVK